jgi:uncharacterized protein with PIN domain
MFDFLKGPIPKYCPACGCELVETLEDIERPSYDPNTGEGSQKVIKTMTCPKYWSGYYHHVSRRVGKPYWVPVKNRCK